MLSFTTTLLIGLLGTASAFPSLPVEVLREAANNVKRQSGSISGAGTVPDPAHAAGLFNAKAQYVSTSGAHAWVAPGPNDQRGPCPGLNAMANHGYIPHNGVANMQQLINGTYTAVGMSYDLAQFLALYGAIFDGDGTQYSIGGPTPLVSAGGLLLKQPQGLSGSHNKYESDASAIRGDLYTHGNDYIAQPAYFKQLYAYQANVPNEKSNYNLEIYQQFRNTRFQDSIHTNPYFFLGPFSGVLVAPAGFTFPYRFMANKSAEHPEGQLTQEVLKSWFAMTGPDANGNFVNKHGYERIPDNWYKRPIGDEYSIPFFLADVLQQASVYPEFLSIGGNTGKVNTFTGVDAADLTAGVYHSATLAQGNNLECFLFQLTEQEGPDFLRGVFNDVSAALAPLDKTVASILQNLGCPQLDSVDNSQFNKFPGYTTYN